MKKIILSLIFLLPISLILVSLAAAYPFYVYNQTLKGEYTGDWYQVKNYRPELLTPQKATKLEDIDMSNEDLWSRFHFMDVVIPLPVKNPFYNITADIKYNEKFKYNNLGLIVLGTDNKELLKIYFNQNSSMPSVIKNQKLFKLPIAKKIIESKTESQVWKDLFARELKHWNVGVEEMIYHLYLLELRSRLLPKDIASYSIISDTDSAIIELVSRNKDFKTELVLTRSRGFIYSYLLVTKLKDDESLKLRRRLLSGIKFRGGSEYLSRIIYQEFKNLDFNEKIDNLGMLYLLSSWSHNQENESLVKEMITNLQRGSTTQLQLVPIIEYSYSRYGRTNVSKPINDLKLSDKVKLKALVELESIRELKKVKIEFKNIDSSPDDETETIFDVKKREAKKDIKSKKTRMIIE